MRQPKKWYRLALTMMMCITFTALAYLEAPVEAYLPLGLVGAVALGSSIAKLWPKK